MNHSITAVLRHYPAELARLSWVPLGSAGGFSGASLWRGEANGEALFCLKAWPTGFEPNRLGSIHRAMFAARVHGQLDFVPAITRTLDQQTFVNTEQLYDLTAWMPGVADFAIQPSDAKLRAACTALAKLHRVWANATIAKTPIPAVARRLEVCRSFAKLPMHVDHPELKRAMALLPPLVMQSIAALELWSVQRVPVFPCLCDVWHDHVLFTGDRVTGIVDYGAMKIDNPAVDLARLLGDLVGDDDARFDFGLHAYHEANPPVEVSSQLVKQLDRTGIVCAIIHWVQRSRFNDASLQRLRKLLDRAECWRGILVNPAEVGPNGVPVRALRL